MFKLVRSLVVQVAVPEDGEYALTMHARQPTQTDFQNICNYLLTSEGEKKMRNKRREWEVSRTVPTVKMTSRTHGTSENSHFLNI